jgi:hypothetical protein
MRALAILALLAGAAHAEPSTIKVPSGWQLQRHQSEEVTRRLNEVGQFGFARGAKTIMANADIYVAPDPGVTLSVTVIAAKLQDQREAAARAAVDELHGASQRAALSGEGVVEEGWQETIDAAAKQIEATLAWRDTRVNISSSARLLVVADAEHMVSVTGECVAAADANAKLVAECKAALATLDPGIAPDKRIALALAPAGTRPTSPPPPDVGSARQPARMDDGSRAPLPPIPPPAEKRATDRRPVYVGLGLVVLAAVFWWNRRRRARREEEP